MGEAAREWKADTDKVRITDISDDRAFRRYRNAQAPIIEKATRALWREQSKVITHETMQEAITTNQAPAVWLETWDRLIREYVRDDIVTEWVKHIKKAGKGIAKNINSLELKVFDFDSVSETIKAWIDDEAGKLITNLTTAQEKSINTLLENQIQLGVSSPYVLTKRLKPLIGLTARESVAVGRYMEGLYGEGFSSAEVTKRSTAYANYLHKNRAHRIAVTEIADAYNYGQEESIRQAVDTGALPFPPEKEWMAGGPNPCPICLANEDQAAIPLEDEFQGGKRRPTQHPHCACSISYVTRRSGTAVPDIGGAGTRVEGHIDNDEWNDMFFDMNKIQRDSKNTLWLKNEMQKATGKWMKHEDAERMLKVLKGWTGSIAGPSVRRL